MADYIDFICGEECIDIFECNAPLCPRDPHVDICPWFPDEDVCHKHRAPDWVKRQRKIKKKCPPEHYGSYFTPRMLKQPCRLTKSATKGLNPDSKLSHEEQEYRWLKNHPPITKEERKQLRRNAKRNFRS